MVEPALQPADPQSVDSRPVERRSAARRPTRFPVPLDHRGFGERHAWALDLSATGMLVRVRAEVPIWSHAVATLPAIGERDVRIVRRDGARYGCLFARPLEGEELDALLASPEAEAGFAALAAEAAAPPPPRRGFSRIWPRRDRAAA